MAAGCAACHGRGVNVRRLVTTPQGVVVVGRAAAYGLCLGLSLIQGSRGGNVVVLSSLLVVALLASLQTTRRPVVWAPYVEAAVAATVVAYASPGDPIGLPYLLAPALEAGLLWGFVEVVTTVGVAAIALTVAPLVTESKGLDARTYASLVAEWLVLSLATGAVAAWARQLRLAVLEPEDTAS